MSTLHYLPRNKAPRQHPLLDSILEEENKDIHKAAIAGCIVAALGSGAMALGLGTGVVNDEINAFADQTSVIETTIDTIHNLEYVALTLGAGALSLIMAVSGTYIIRGSRESST